MMLGGKMKSGEAFVIRVIYLGASLEKKENDLGLIAAGGEMQSGPALFDFLIDFLTRCKP
ncbi:MAG: hypothetical protein RL095_1225 [Verrucomicrobiota bacterium]